VSRAHDRALLRQAFVQRQNHCNFTSAELVTGLLALQHRVQTGSWDSVAQPGQLEVSASSHNLGGAAFAPFWPDRLSGNNGPFDPFADGARERRARG
jgi:hypothetical protein